MTEDLFFMLLNSILSTLVLVLFYPLFKAKTLMDLDDALDTRPFLAKALKRPDARNYFHHLVYCGLALVAYHWLLTDEDASSTATDMPLATLSIVVLFVISIARVWKFRRLLARAENAEAMQKPFFDFPAPEEQMGVSDREIHKVEEILPQRVIPAALASAPEPLFDALRCPSCDSIDIHVKNYAKKTGGAVGAMAGTAAGVASMAGGAEIGATVGMMGGPVGVALGGLTGALIGALVGAATGCAAGKAIGGMVDDTLLDNYTCRECGYTFNKQGY